MVTWPSISETILGLTFLPRSSVAQVYRRSWKCVCGGPVCFRSGVNRWVVTLRRSNRLPVSEARWPFPNKVNDGFG